MQQVYLQTHTAQQRLERLHNEAKTYKFIARFGWRKKIASVLVRVANKLEPTLSPSIKPHSLEPLHP